MIKKIIKLFYNKTFVKFIIVGLSGILVNMMFLFLFKQVFTFELWLAGIMAIELSVISNFIFNNYWTFKNNHEGSMPFTFIKYHLSVFLGMLINYIILIILTKQFGIVYWFSNLIGIGFGTISNYLFSSQWAWKKK